MRVLSKKECQAAILKIISDFGDGRLKEGHYIFDGITRLPPGYLEKRVTVGQLISELKHGSVLLVVFDPHSNNNASRLHLLHSLGFDDDLDGLEVERGDLPRLFENNDCDFYVIVPNGPLLAVASHEDEIRGNERIIWCPIPVPKV
jgi:hypothetical protein